MKSILDPTFRYTSSANTDLRKTFERIRNEQQERENALPQVLPANVVVLAERKPA